MEEDGFRSAIQGCSSWFHRATHGFLRELLYILPARNQLCTLDEEHHYSSSKDLINIREDASRGDTRNDLATVVAQLRKTPGYIDDVVVEDENKLRGIFYQDAQMQKMLAAFPDVLFVDATCKLNGLRTPVYILIVEDGNGHSKIVEFWLAASKDRMTIKQMVDLVVRHNPWVSQVRDIMGYKDFNEREVFAQTFPGQQCWPLYITCCGHSLEQQCWSADITRSKHNSERSWQINWE